MSDAPRPVARLDELERATFIAHETIFELRSALIREELTTPRADALLAESSRITLRDVTAIAEPLRRLASRWHEELVLAPDDLQEIEAKLEDALADVEPQLQALLQRQAEIAAELRGALRDRR